MGRVGIVQVIFRLCLAVSALSFVVGARVVVGQEANEQNAKERAAKEKTPTQQVEKGQDAQDPMAAEAARREERELLKLFIDTLDQVERNYVKDVSRRELYEAAIRGMMSKLDQHSNYISPDDVESFKGSVESEFGGIGIQVSIEGGRLVVISPLVGTPAYRAGIQAGDWISSIDDKTTREITLDEAVKRMKGKIGTTVKLNVVHARDGKSETLTLAREVVRVETVLGDRRNADDSWDYMLDPERLIGYIRITSFGRHTTNEMRKAMKSLADRKLRGLVLDLRFNPGGLLSSAIEISDLFVSEGRIVSTAGRNIDEQVVYAKEEGTYTGFPIVVLVNRFSASASEIVSACLQDHSRAIVIGERTWGKGSVQNIIELEGGRSALKLTTAGYQRPNGRNINRFEGATEEDEWGVKPNSGFEVKLTDDEMRQMLDDRRDRDIVKKREGEISVADAIRSDRQLAKALETISLKLTEAKKDKPEDATKATSATDGKDASSKKPATDADAAGKP